MLPFSVGDVYAGTYCGEDREGDGIMNCPRGYYCPTPEEKYICPAGFYCPYKTSNPDFICRQCKEGAQSVQRGLYGYITLGLFLVIIFIHCMIKVAERNNRGFAKLVQGLGLGLKITVRNSETFGNKKVDADLLAKIRPKLKLINRRLAELTEKQSRKNLSDSFTGSSKKQKKQETDDAHFDARRVFDLLDDDHSGDVDFDEINAILELNCFELSEFVRRMNELAGIKDKEKMKSVTRPVFVKYFLTVLKETANLTVTFEEAEAMFDEMANIGRTKVDKIHMSKFYVSSMSDFLSDIQILDLIKRFKQMKKDSAPSSDNRNRRVSRIGRQSLALSRGRSIRLSGGRRPSIGIQDQVNDASLMIVSKDVFTEHYPQFLMDITIEANAEVDEEALVSETPGVDIVFQDLSLNIKVGDGNISVVENVTGRLRGRTMTALMGGSGAGKTSLLNALCGRAFYGETTGTIHVNGHKTSIEEHKDAVGFVPQDDIVYAELTVRENLIFAGRFRLPKGTSDEEIKELADETLANLGLSRVADSPVGDVRRRGVSGGEKKRVNIGLELMARPSVLFLDEPTSGLVRLR